MYIMEEKYTDSNETDIASYNDLIKDNYFVRKDNVGDINCSSLTFGDPLPNVTKQCICKVKTGGATVTQSSTAYDGLPTYVNDGNIDSNQKWPNSNHTQKDGDQWLELDLNNNFIISRIVVYNRPDCCMERLNGAKIKLLDENREQVYPTIGLTGERQQEFMIRTNPKGQSCGYEGTNVYVNVYPNVKDNQPTYLGCFNDSSNRRMEWDGSPYMSFDDCKQKAIDNKKPFFALQDTQEDGLSACMLSNNIVKTTSEGDAVSYNYVWASNTNTTNSNTRYLELGYDGNLMIKDSSDNDKIVWQTNTGDDSSYVELKNTDYPGNDIEGKEMSSSDCQTYCDNLNECVGYNSSTSSNFCYFKKALGNINSTDSWNFHVKGRNTFLILQNDGNMVLYTGSPGDGEKKSNRKVLWSSNTKDSSGMVVENWKPDKNTNNKYKTNYLLPGQRLGPSGNQQISSKNGKRVATMQEDGNFVLYKGDTKCLEKNGVITGASWTNSVYMLNDTIINSKEGGYKNGEFVSDIQPVNKNIQLGECMSKCESSNECNSFSYGKVNSDDDYRCFNIFQIIQIIINK